ncbi:MAG TPA: 16S rRNA (guanine(527)-N(7))-methyltransferase RsmG [Tepidisphaeraceae bacterium]|jgi:16S rRNA (guanine527-N7)-methyltransferase|nr:16S rRNA (guanine(527)-N(7))-methyltransferase RsmG [Tepidisphaeraceae bacterium]
MADMHPLWNELAAKANVTLTEAQHEQLSTYLKLLTAANNRMNLTRIVDRETAEVQHIGDALTVLPHLPPGGHSLADVGTGGGVPGIPLAIARPDVRVTLIEATKKKAAFLTEAVTALGLTNVRITAERAEEAATGGRRESFDVVVARAVATMPWLAEWCLPLARKGGKVLCLKGPKAHEELPFSKKAIRLGGGGSPIIHPVELPGTENRIIVEIRKVDRSDSRLPRPPSGAKGGPL